MKGLVYLILALLSGSVLIYKALTLAIKPSILMFLGCSLAFYAMFNLIKEEKEVDKWNNLRAS